VNITQAYLNRLGPSLSDRDLAIARVVGRFKIMTGDQLERLFFDHCSDTSRARNRQQVLKRLTQRQVLGLAGQRRIGGARAGSAQAIFTLDIAGQHLAEMTGNRPRRPYSWYEPTIEHFLAVAELYVQLMEAERSGDILKLLAYDPEPYCWRDFGADTLKPDAYVELAVEHQGQRYRGSLFIEVDRANQYGAKISSKLPQYVSYYRHHRAVTPGQTFPRIVFLAPDERRVRYLTGLLDDRAEARQLFHVGLLSEPLPALLQR